MEEKEYTVKLTFKYSDTVTVKACTKEDAIERARLAAEETFECLYDEEILNISKQWKVMNLEDLKKPFPANKIHWRVGAFNVNPDGSLKWNDNNYPYQPVGIPLAFIDARDLYERLDEVCGADMWQLRYPFSGCCEIGILVGVDDKDRSTEWIWKANGAGVTDIEADKGQYSDAAKRAGVPWGIAQYLYDLPNVWMPIKKSGRSYKFDKPVIKQLNERYEGWVAEYFKHKNDPA